MNAITITPNDFEKLLMTFESHPYISEYKAVMDAYRAVCHYATWHEDDNGTWKCGACEGEWVFDDGTPRENNVKYCPMCGAIIEAFCEWKWEDEE